VKQKVKGILAMYVLIAPRRISSDLRTPASRGLRVFVVNFVFFLVACLFTSCASTPKQPLSRYEFEEPQMGLPFRIVLYASNDAAANRASDAAFARIKELNNVFSDYEYDSELSALSRSAGEGRPVKVTDDLWRVLERSEALARESGGAFDITVGPFTTLWRKARREHILPDPDKIKERAAAVGYDKIILDPRNHTALLTVPQMRLDMGGIAKGYAIDEALKVIRSNGITRALVMGGGDMAAGDPPPSKDAWRIELVRLDAPGSPSAKFVLLKNRALATSGDLSQRLEINGTRYSHIVDPHTGIGLTDHSLVNVIARDCMTADSLTKVVSVLGYEKGFPIVLRRPGAAARVLRQPSDSIEGHETENFKNFCERKNHLRQ
jgi:thiamine biosynthesis lipoprotein